MAPTLPSIISEITANVMKTRIMIILDVIIWNGSYDYNETKTTITTGNKNKVAVK